MAWKLSCDALVIWEEVGEAMYRIDRSLFHITSNAEIRPTLAAAAVASATSA